MNATETTTPAAPKATLSKATSLLFHIAVRSHTLAQMFGIERVSEHGNMEVRNMDSTNYKLVIHRRERAWLVAHPTHPEELSFDPDAFAKRLDYCSSGERHMMLFILNVWNPNYAKNNNWTFDLFKALDSLDTGNRQAIAWWLENPVWP